MNIADTGNEKIPSRRTKSVVTSNDENFFIPINCIDRTWFGQMDI